MLRSFVRSLLIAGAALVLPATAAAQGTPSQTTQAFFDALWARRWTDAAALVSPEGIGRYRGEVVPLAAQLRLDAHHMGTGGGGVMPDDTTALPPVIRFDLATHDTIRLDVFGGSFSVRELLEMPAADFMGRAFAEAFTWQVGAGAPENGLGPTPSIIGDVVRGDSAYVVVSVPTDDEHGGEPRLVVVPTRRENGQWRVLMSQQLEVPFGVASLPDYTAIGGEEPEP